MAKTAGDTVSMNMKRGCFVGPGVPGAILLLLDGLLDHGGRAFTDCWRGGR